MTNQLKNTVKQHIKISDAEFEKFENIFKLTEIHKRTIVLEKGQVPKNAYFILNGSMRFYYESNGEEITGNIFTENMFATSHDGFLLQTPSKYAVESIESTTVLEFSFSDLQKAIEEVPAIQELISKVLIRRLTLAHQVISRLITLSPEERYLKVLEENPEWIQRLPHHIIASYIGISATSFSRIRKRIVN
jgi:CRP-like cAMP-binding protein